MLLLDLVAPLRDALRESSRPSGLSWCLWPYRRPFAWIVGVFPQRFAVARPTKA